MTKTKNDKKQINDKMLKNLKKTLTKEVRKHNDFELIYECKDPFDVTCVHKKVDKKCP